MEKIVPPLSHPGVRHQDTGFSASGVVWFSVGLIGTLLVAGALMGGLMLLFEKAYPVFPQVRTPALRFEESPAPLLQAAPEEDLAQLRQTTREVLNSYGWVDRQAGTVRVPIERAIDIMARRGFPVRMPPKATGPEPVGKPSPSLPPPPESPFSGEAYQGD